VGEMFRAGEYLIDDTPDGLKWKDFRELDDGLYVFYGPCTVDDKAGVLMLSPIEGNAKSDVSSLSERQAFLNILPLWDKTDYFAEVSASGGLDIFRVDNGEKVDDSLTAEISSKIGCTMRYR